MDWRSELRQAFRTFRAHAAFSAAVVITLAAGIAGNTAVFTLIDATLLRPLPYAHPETLVLLDAVRQAERTSNGFTLDRYETFRDRSRALAAVAVATTDTLNFSGVGMPEQVSVARVSGNFFQTLGIQPAQGRLFTDSDARPESAAVVVLSDAFWRDPRGGDSAPLGRTIRLGSMPFAIVGVLPRGLTFPFIGSVDVWIPRYFELSLFPRERLRMGVGYLTAVARLSPGQSIESARAEASVLDRRYAQTHAAAPDVTGVETTVTSVREFATAHVRDRLLLLSAAVALVLLIACANVANLLLARGLARNREMAVRAALGASRHAMLRQLLTENLTLAVAAGIVGFALGVAVLGAAKAIAPEQFAIAPATPDVRVVVFTAALSVLTGIVFGIAPALRASKTDLEQSLREEGTRSTPSRAHAVVRSSLVIAQVGLSLVLLVAAGLLVHSLSRLLHVDTGFDPDGVLTMSVSLPSSKYATPAQQVAFFDRLLQRVSTLPGVRSAAVSSALPPMKKRMTPLLAEGQPEVPLSDRPVMTIEMVSPRWFATLHVPLRAGRVFTESDNAASPKVLIVNDAFARRFWPNEPAVGKHVALGRQPPSEVVGVVGDVKNNGLGADAQPQVYVPFAQLPWTNMNLLVRSAAEPRSLVNAIRDDVLSIDPEQPVSAIATVDDLLSGARADLRSTTVLLAAFSVLAFALALLGISAVLAYSIAERRRELAIRIALGARSADVMKAVFGQGFVLVGIGLIAGAATSLIVSKALSNVVYQVSVIDPAAFASAMSLFVLAAGLTMYLPARRAAFTDVLRSLR
jgi:putative ABC transport system permease protein